MSARLKPPVSSIAAGLFGVDPLSTFRLYRTALVALIPIVWASGHLYAAGIATFLLPWLVASFVLLELSLSTRQTPGSPADVFKPAVGVDSAGGREGHAAWLDEFSTFSLDALVLSASLWLTNELLVACRGTVNEGTLRLLGPLFALPMSAAYLYSRIVVLDPASGPLYSFRLVTHFVTRSAVHWGFDPTRSPISLTALSVSTYMAWRLGVSATRLESWSAVFLAVACIYVGVIRFRAFVAATEGAYRLGSWAKRLVGIVGWSLLAALVLGNARLFLAEATAGLTLAAATQCLLVRLRRRRLRHQADYTFASPRATLSQRLATAVAVRAPARLVIRLIERRTTGFRAALDGKALAKRKCDILRGKCRYRQLIDVAHRYNSTLSRKSKLFSQTLKNNEILAHVWLGELERASSLVEREIKSSPESPYFYYTKARILWQQRELDEALASIDHALSLYELQRGKSCVPASKHKMAFLWEKALGQIEQGRNADAARTLQSAEALCLTVLMDNFERTAPIASDGELVHNGANIYLLEGLASNGVDSRLVRYRNAGREFAWCISTTGYSGARFRLALLKSIGTTEYEQSIGLLEWIRSSLLRSNYSSALPFSRLVDNVVDGLRWASERGIVLNERLLLYQRPVSRRLRDDPSLVSGSAAAVVESKEINNAILRSLQGGSGRVLCCVSPSETRAALAMQH